MTKIYDIQKRTLDLACRIVELHRRLAARADLDRTLSLQLLRAGTSIGANMEEAHAAQSRADFVTKCSIALKEARETNYWLRLFVETGIASMPEIKALLVESSEIIAILTTIRRNARSKS